MRFLRFSFRREVLTQPTTLPEPCSIPVRALPGSVLCRDGKDSMASEQNYRVTFIATYQDGRQLLFTVDKFTLTEGDYAARIACERQKAGELPPGKIMSVARSLTPSP